MSAFTDVPGLRAGTQRKFLTAPASPEIGAAMHRQGISTTPTNYSEFAPRTTGAKLSDEQIRIAAIEDWQFSLGISFEEAREKMLEILQGETMTIVRAKHLNFDEAQREVYAVWSARM